MNTETVIRYLTMAVVVVTSLPVHELAHGLTANWLGDHTAKDQGRLTLNPFAHLAVSYTHLDVYKRQAMNRTNF